MLKKLIPRKANFGKRERIGLTTAASEDQDTIHHNHDYFCNVQTQLKTQSQCYSLQTPIASIHVCATVLLGNVLFFDGATGNFRRQDGCIRMEIKALYMSTSVRKGRKRN